MIGTFAEGAASLALPCTWPLVIPPLLAIVASRGRMIVAAGGLAGMLVAGWGRLAGIDLGHPVLLGIVLIGAYAAIGWGPARWLHGLAAITIGLIAGALWTPCVGPRLGAILTDGPSVGGLAGISVFLVGVGLPLPGSVFAHRAIRRSERRGTTVSATFTGLGIAYGMLIATGLHAGLLSTLAAWSVGT